MTVDGFQLLGLARSSDPVHIALHRIQIGAHLAIAQAAYPGSLRVDAEDDAATGLLLIAGHAIGDAAVHLHRTSGRDAG